MNAARALLVALSLIAFQPQPVLSDPDLTAAVNLAFLPRTESAELHTLAHQRAFEVAQPGGWCHCGATTPEVLAYSTIGPLRAVDQWLGSPDHLAVLSDPSLTFIGCGSYFDGTTYWVACMLGAAPESTSTPAEPSPQGSVGGIGPVAQPAPTPASLPNTRMP